MIKKRITEFRKAYYKWSEELGAWKIVFTFPLTFTAIYTISFQMRLQKEIIAGTGLLIALFMTGIMIHHRLINPDSINALQGGSSTPSS